MCTCVIDGIDGRIRTGQDEDVSTLIVVRNGGFDLCDQFNLELRRLPLLALVHLIIFLHVTQPVLGSRKCIESRCGVVIRDVNLCAVNQQLCTPQGLTYRLTVIYS